jgi:hypothetical protein
MPDCRICLESDYNLISPCLCKGSVEFIHSTCLEKWRGLDSDLKKYAYCDICNSKYDTNLVLSTELIPDYNNSTVFRFFINPFLVSGAIYLLFVIILLSSETDRLMLKQVFILLEYIISASYFGLYINLFRVVRNKRRYFLHIKSNVLLLPVSQIFVYFAMNSNPIPISLLNHFILSQYLFLHSKILKSMNQDYALIVEGGNN